ncbi:MAG: Gfo/Idh/MocA family oxidoreductase, partial [Bacteroidales bacterium]|nr:Gfo/Idh/MocA family oxidoreductase [Bacteroidales bacterium]
MKRRDFFKFCGVAAAGTALSQMNPLEAMAAGAPPAFNDVTSLNDVDLNIRGLSPKTDRQITIIIIGAGSRGNTYARYAQLFPDKVKVVGVSDINDYRLHKLSDLHDVPVERRYGDFSEILSVPKFADAAVICTPDDVHYAPTMMALKLGYHVLVEKPIAPTEKECRD